MPVADLSREEFRKRVSRGAGRGDEGRDRRISPDDFEVAGHGSISSAISAASGASSLVKLAIVAASMAPGFRRSSPSGWPAFAQQGQVGELRAAVAFAKRVDRVQLGEQVRGALRELRWRKATQEAVTRQPLEQRPHFVVDVLGITEHAAALGDAHGRIFPAHAKTSWNRWR